MNWNDVFKLSGAIITSIGGAGLIIVALSSWLGNVWAKRILEKDKLKYQLELENVKNQLQSEAQKQQLVFSLYFEGQFKIYNDLWLSLSELKEKVDILWDDASKKNLISFMKSLQKSKRQIMNSALLIEKNHYEDILEHLITLENYELGKEGVIRARNIKLHDSVDNGDIQILVEMNAKSREQITEFTEIMLDKMRTQISGTQNESANHPIFSKC